MNEIEQYEFDRQGYIIIPNMLTDEAVQSLREAVDKLEEHALAHVDLPPRKLSTRGREYHVNEEKGYHVSGSNAEGKTLIIEDFWNADSAFDRLVNHRKTLPYVEAVINGRYTINNSEIRIRYKGNASSSHGGTRPENKKYQYTFTDRIDCMMVRMIYLGVTHRL